MTKVIMDFEYGMGISKMMFEDEFYQQVAELHAQSVAKDFQKRAIEEIEKHKKEINDKSIGVKDKIELVFVAGLVAQCDRFVSIIKTLKP